LKTHLFFCHLLQTLPDNQVKEVPKLVSQYVLSKTLDQRKALIKSIGDQKQVKKNTEKKLVTSLSTENISSEVVEENGKSDKMKTRRGSFNDKMGQIPNVQNENNQNNQNNQISSPSNQFSDSGISVQDKRKSRSGFQ